MNWRPKAKHWTPTQEAQLAEAERCNYRAYILELGAAEFLKSQSINADNLEEVRTVLADAVTLRKRSRMIHEHLQSSPRSRKSKPSPKAQANKKGRSK